MELLGHALEPLGVVSADIRPVPVKTIEQQQLQSLHRLRTQCIGSRLRGINALRGILREFGVTIAMGAVAAKEQIGRALAEPDSGIPPGLRSASFRSAGSRERVAGSCSCLVSFASRHDSTPGSKAPGGGQPGFT